jgi:hypothetical protein
LIAKSAMLMWQVHYTARLPGMNAALGSPAMGGVPTQTANGLVDAATPGCWLDRFLSGTNARLNGDSVDFICVHWCADTHAVPTLLLGGSKCYLHIFKDPHNVAAACPLCCGVDALLSTVTLLWKCPVPTRICAACHQLGVFCSLPRKYKRNILAHLWHCFSQTTSVCAFCMGTFHPHACLSWVNLTAQNR